MTTPVAVLAPQIVETIMDGCQPAEMTLPGLTKGVAVEWGEQSAAAG